MTRFDVSATLTRWVYRRLSTDVIRLITARIIAGGSEERADASPGCRHVDFPH